MRTILLILIIANATATYSQTDFYNCPIKNKAEFADGANLKHRIILAGKDTSFYSWQIDTGKQIIFKYSQDYSCDPTFHEAVYTTLLWPVPANRTSFRYAFSSLDSLSTPLIYKTGCGPPCRRYNFDLVAASGFIKGEKKSDKEWIINATIKMSLFNRMQNTTAQKEISFEKNFVLWEQKKKDKKGYRFYGF